MSSSSTAWAGKSSTEKCLLWFFRSLAIPGEGSGARCEGACRRFGFQASISRVLCCRLQKGGQESPAAEEQEFPQRCSPAPLGLSSGGAVPSWSSVKVGSSEIKKSCSPTELTVAVPGSGLCWDAPGQGVLAFVPNNSLPIPYDGQLWCGDVCSSDFRYTDTTEPETYWQKHLFFYEQFIFPFKSLE